MVISPRMWILFEISNQILVTMSGAVISCAIQVPCPTSYRTRFVEGRVSIGVCVHKVLTRSMHIQIVLSVFPFLRNNSLWLNIFMQLYDILNLLNAKLNPICYLLALLAHHFLHVSRIRVKSLTLRLLMSYICGPPILYVSRSHTTTHHSR